MSLAPEPPREAANGGGFLTLPPTNGENLLPRGALGPLGHGQSALWALGDLDLKRKKCTVPWLLGLWVKISVKRDSGSTDGRHFGMHHKPSLRDLRLWPWLWGLRPNSLAEHYQQSPATWQLGNDQSEVVLMAFPRQTFKLKANCPNPTRLARGKPTSSYSWRNVSRYRDPSKSWELCTGPK